MAKPDVVNLSKKDQKTVLSMWMGNKKEKGIKNARKIAETLNLPRHHVMAFLEDRGECSFSEKSYC
jgi:hypothetical protein